MKRAAKKSPLDWKKLRAQREEKKCKEWNGERRELNAIHCEELLIYVGLTTPSPSSVHDTSVCVCSYLCLCLCMWHMRIKSQVVHVHWYHSENGITMTRKQNDKRMRAPQLCGLLWQWDNYCLVDSPWDDYDVAWVNSAKKRQSEENDTKKKKWETNDYYFSNWILPAQCHSAASHFGR